MYNSFVVKKILTLTGGLFFGVIIGYLFIYYPANTSKDENIVSFTKHQITGNQVIGFLPYWLLSKARDDYSPYINTLTYFGLTLDTDGTILKLQNPQETEPGWYALNSGKADPFLNKARDNNQKLSLLVFNANEASISALMKDPVPHARNLISDVKPIMQKYEFTDLNLDIESTRIASDGARLQFTKFVKEVKKGMDDNDLGTLTIDISGDSLVKKRLINLADVAPFVDYVVIMAYDYHYIGSQITGPVAPLFGAGISSEYDTQAAVEIALKVVSPKKLILGIPLYGYEWETLGDAARSATVPSSGQTASTQRINQLLTSCASCSAQFDDEAKENYLIYKDGAVDTYHQFFYPNNKATQAKIDYAKQQKLGGLALWALGYEESTILEPLRKYR